MPVSASVKDDLRSSASFGLLRNKSMDYWVSRLINNNYDKNKI